MVLEKKIFKGFYYIKAWRPLHKEAQHDIGQAVSESQMLLAKFQDHRTSGSGEEDF